MNILCESNYSYGLYLWFVYFIVIKIGLFMSLSVGYAEIPCGKPEPEPESEPLSEEKLGKDGFSNKTVELFFLLYFCITIIRM